MGNLFMEKCSHMGKRKWFAIGKISIEVGKEGGLLLETLKLVPCSEVGTGVVCYWFINSKTFPSS